jgi:hypothetical protein
MVTPEPSTEKWSGSLGPAKRLMATPGTRCSASVTDRSGRAPMSCDVMTSTTVSELRLMFCEVLRLCRMPVTMIAPLGVGAD